MRTRDYVSLCCCYWCGCCWTMFYLRAVRRCNMHILQFGYCVLLLFHSKRFFSSLHVSFSSCSFFDLLGSILDWHCVLLAQELCYLFITTRLNFYRRILCCCVRRPLSPYSFVRRSYRFLFPLVFIFLFLLIAEADVEPQHWNELERRRADTNCRNIITYKM